MQGDRDFDKLFRDNYQSLFFFARSFVDNEEECRDLVEDVFEEAWKNFGSLKPGAAKAWLFKNLRNKCIDHLRHNNHRLKYVAFIRIMGHQFEDPETLPEIEDRQRIIKQRLNLLKPPTDRIFRACYIEHKKYAEVAAMLHISTDTVKKHIIRALKIVRLVPVNELQKRRQEEQPPKNNH
jgi:RNA polymerase sigma-70 factor (ECF subfamily)